MSSSDDTDYQEHQQKVTHYINEKIKRNGGEIPISSVVFSIKNELDDNITPHMAQQIIRGESEPAVGHRFDIKHRDNTEVITGVDPIGEKPDVIDEIFTTRNLSITDIDSIPEFDSEIVDHLVNAGYSTLEDIAAGDPEHIKEVVNKAKIETADPCDFAEYTHLTSSSTDVLTDQGIETAPGLLTSDPEEIVANDSRDGISLTESDINAACQQLTDNGFKAFSTDDAQSAIENAELNIPTGPSLAEKSLTRSKHRVDTVGGTKAIIKQTEEETQTVGDPLPHVKKDLDKSDPEAVYVSDIGQNSSDPIHTGLPVLEDVGYDRVPKPETHPEASDNALPVEDGEVIPPAIPVEQNLQVPMDEIVAKILAENKPLMIKGPRGSGKNYLIKYLCYRTNRGYRSFDAHDRMVAEDLFGPISPNEDGVLEPKNGPLKQGLINGDVIVIDEFSAMPPNVGMSLHQLLQDNEVVIPSQGQYLKPHPEAKIVATRNPATIEYAGNHDSNAATLGRFRELEQNYIKSVSAEVEAIARQVNSDRTIVTTDTLEDIVEFAHRTRKDRNQNWPTISTRDISTICDYIKYGASAKGSIKKVLKKRARQGQNLSTIFDALGETVSDQ